jgi:2-methylisocitrate lyase-like PEP mutase family enzyme
MIRQPVDRIRKLKTEVAVGFVAEDQGETCGHVPGKKVLPTNFGNLK